MNVEALNNANLAAEQKRLDARLRSLATNVVQESRVAYGRGALPFTDDEAQRLDAIFNILHLPTAEAIDPQYEHFPLVSDQQPKADPRLDKIADLLAADLADAPIEETATGLTVTAAPVKKAIKA